MSILKQKQRKLSKSFHIHFESSAIQTKKLNLGFYFTEYDLFIIIIGSTYKLEGERDCIYFDYSLGRSESMGTGFLAQFENFSLIVKLDQLARLQMERLRNKLLT